MTNALTVLSKTPMTELSELDRALLAEAQSERDAYDFVPPRLKIGGSGTNIFQTEDGDILRTLTGIILVSQKARAYWPGKGGDKAPLCSSNDGSRGVLNLTASDEQIQDATRARRVHPGVELLIHQDAPIPDFFDCATCPLAQWGSQHQGGNGKGQACKALRRLVIKLDDWNFPALITLPPTSIKSYDIYATSMARQPGSAYFTVHTQISLNLQKSASGDPYSVAVFQRAGELTPVEKAAVLEVRQQYAALVRRMDIDVADYEVVETGPEETETAPF